LKLPTAFLKFFYVRTADLWADFTSFVIPPPAPEFNIHHAHTIDL